MDFPLFVLLNFLLLVRPEDLYPPLAGFRLYLVTIVLCTVTALPELQRTLSRDDLRTRPVTVCVLGLLVATFASFGFRGRFTEGLDFCTEFAKVVLFYLLLVSVVNTPGRLRAYLGWVVVFVTGIAAASLLQHHGVVEFEGIKPPVLQWEYDAATGTTVLAERIVSVGLFDDPNDLCVIVAFGMTLALGMAATSAGTLGTLAWLLPLPPLAYCCVLTKSRGGMLAILAAVAGTAFARLGWKRSAPFVAAAVPALALAVGGRGGDVGSGGGTAHERLMLWAVGLSDLFRMPFHIPTGLAPGYYVEEHQYVAHNSYVNAYVELGLLGGGLFFMAFYSAARMSYAALTDPAAPPWARAVGPYLFGATASYAVGCYSLTRNFHIPTYLALGVTVAYASLARPEPDPRYRVDRAWWGRFLLVSAAGLVALKYATQALGVMGV